MNRQPTKSPEAPDDALAIVESLRRQNEETAAELATLRAELRDLRRERERFHLEHERARVFMSAIDQCSESIVFTDTDGRILYVNHSFEESSGYKLAELIGRTPRILKSGEHPPEFYRGIWETVLAGEVWRSRITNRRKDGTLYQEEASVAPVRDDQGGIMCFVSVKKDISELLEHKQALEKINLALTKSNAELQQFAYVASHDLQEPLRAVASCMQLLKKYNSGTLDERSGEFVDHAVSACLRMQELIEGLLTISRVHATTDHLQPTDVETAFEQACANLSFAIRSTGATITFGSLPTVQGHQQLLTHLFQNLLSNALKFCGREAPVIRVEAVRKGRFWQISVEDNGIGIEDEYAERIFQIFQRLHTREEYPGTGIGLAICQKIVTQHGGRIWVRSRPGHGATFSFTLPAVCEPRVPCQESEPESQANETHEIPAH